jgi:hypothetical protein
VRQSQNQAAAGNAYTQPNPRELERNNDLSGVPWGSLNMRHVFERGQQAAQQGNRTPSSYSSQATAAEPTSSSGYYGTFASAEQEVSYYYDNQQSQGQNVSNPQAYRGNYSGAGGFAGQPGQGSGYYKH